MIRIEEIRIEDLRYAARLPWIGPIVGGLLERGGSKLRIGGASGPLHDHAIAAVLVPVIRDSAIDHLVPSDARGEPRAIAEVGWAFPLDNDRYGHFAIEAPLSLWDGEVDGVLMLLLHDRSPVAINAAGMPERYFSGPWQVHLQHLFKLGVKAPRGGLTEPMPIRDLPKEMQEQIAKDVCKQFYEPIKTLEAGLIVLDPWLTGSAKPVTEITFAVASCQYPAGFLDSDIAERAYKRLARCLDRKEGWTRPKCLLLVGDQIYADATAGLFDPSTLYDRFEFPYERLLRMPALRRIQRRIPVYMMLDDHEIEDNWEPVADERGADKNLIDGRRFYLTYQRIAGPAPQPPLPDSPQPLWYEFELNGFPFFIADTRTERDHRTAQSVPGARIMKESQFEALLAWLADLRGQDVPKFIASPACLLPRKVRARQTDHSANALRSDAWDGYPHSLDRLLAFIVDNEIRNVIFLSGDEHISFATRATISRRDSGKAMAIHSIHSSALYAPFPFANATADDLAWDETFHFTLPPEGQGRPGGSYECRVATQFAPLGDGFTLVRASLDNGKWVVRCRFSRDRYAPPPFAGGGIPRGRLRGGRFVPNPSPAGGAKWFAVL